MRLLLLNCLIYSLPPLNCHPLIPNSPQLLSRRKIVLSKTVCRRSEEEPVTQIGAVCLEIGPLALIQCRPRLISYLSLLSTLAFPSRHVSCLNFCHVPTCLAIMSHCDIVTVKDYTSFGLIPFPKMCVFHLLPIPCFLFYPFLSLLHFQPTLSRQFRGNFLHRLGLLS